jgi:hypothetical protein
MPSEHKVNNRAWMTAIVSPFTPSSWSESRGRVCSRTGSYRPARLAAKYGPEFSLRDLTDRFSYDCLWREEARSKRRASSCGVCLPDLERPRPPDLPAGMVKLRLVKVWHIAGPHRFVMYIRKINPSGCRRRFRMRQIYIGNTLITCYSDVIADRGLS